MSLYVLNEKIWGIFMSEIILAMRYKEIVKKTTGGTYERDLIYMTVHKWHYSYYVSCGSSGVILKDGRKVYTTSYFSIKYDGQVISSEKEKIEDAERDVFNIYKKMKSCSDHKFIKLNGRAAVCEKCNKIKVNYFPPEESCVICNKKNVSCKFDEVNYCIKHFISYVAPIVLNRSSMEKEKMAEVLFKKLSNSSEVYTENIKNGEKCKELVSYRLKEAMKEIRMYDAILTNSYDQLFKEEYLLNDFISALHSEKIRYIFTEKNNFINNIAKRLKNSDFISYEFEPKSKAKFEKLNYDLVTRLECFFDFEFIVSKMEEVFNISKEKMFISGFGVPEKQYKEKINILFEDELMNFIVK